jgi:AcrR family transcriptional regulator
MARPRSDIQPRIVRAARERFLAEGVDGASLRTIASDAGTNVGMVFYYFPTKDDLFLAVVEEVYSKLLDDLGVALAGDAPVRDRLKRVFTRIGGASDEEMQVVRLVIRESLLSSARFQRVFARMQRGHVAMLLTAFGEGVRSGEIDASIPLPMLLLTALGMGAMPQFVRRAAGDQPPFAMLPGPEELAQISVDLLFRAIRAARPAARRRPAAPKEAKRRAARGRGREPGRSA